MSERLQIDRVSKTWEAGGPAPIEAVREVSLVVRAGECVVVTGPSGSGKTTLLSMLGGLVRPDAGQIAIDGVELAACSAHQLRELRLRKLGFVFQRGLLLEHLSARQNVALVLRAAGTAMREALGRADALLERMGVATRADATPQQLSPGEGQRVALARALAPDPVLILADEPTAHLDRAHGDEVVSMLRDAARERNAGCIVVTHDPRLHKVADRVLALEEGHLRPLPPLLEVSDREAALAS